uniref:PNPLA domain-containing protein n=1 Tax=Leptocylindrus danicus TaxID=163516 RepID=A0A7S2KR00_9STRA
MVPTVALFAALGSIPSTGAFGSFAWKNGGKDLYVKNNNVCTSTTDGSSSSCVMPMNYQHTRRATSFRVNMSTEMVPAADAKKSNILGGVGLRAKGPGDEEVKKQVEPVPTVINSVQELNQLFDEVADLPDNDTLLKSIHVIGDTQIIGSPDHPDVIHPALQVIHERRRRGSQISSISPRPDDGFKVALSIEGGGMRGCVSAGMVGAIHYLGLDDAFDVVYGSSAGSLIGAYFITKQLPWFGPEIYYDALTTAGKKFIDTKRLLRAIGFGMLNPVLLKDVIFRPKNGKPVLDLSFLLRRTVQEKKPLDWDKFVEKQRGGQPLKVVASGLKSEKAVVFDMEKGDFTSLEQLANCMHASMLLPGIAGPIMNAYWSNEGPADLFLENNHKKKEVEPLADALVYEPIPYRSAVEDGATHVVVLRTRADGADVTGKSSIFERLIMRRFFVRKNRLPHIFRYMRKQYHKKLYAEDILVLNEKAKDLSRDFKDTSSPHIATVALSPGSEEITRLETSRRAIFEGVRRGFARAYDALVEDPAQRGMGAQVAKEYFPDEILNYDPDDIDSRDESAFATYLTKVAAERVDSLKLDTWGKRAAVINAPR